MLVKLIIIINVLIIAISSKVIVNEDFKQVDNNIYNYLYARKYLLKHTNDFIKYHQDIQHIENVLKKNYIFGITLERYLPAFKDQILYYHNDKLIGPFGKESTPLSSVLLEQTKVSTTVPEKILVHFDAFSKQIYFITYNKKYDYFLIDIVSSNSLFGLQTRNTVYDISLAKWYEQDSLFKTFSLLSDNFFLTTGNLSVQINYLQLAILIVKIAMTCLCATGLLLACYFMGKKSRHEDIAIFTAKQNAYKLEIKTLKQSDATKSNLLRNILQELNHSLKKTLHLCSQLLSSTTCKSKINYINNIKKILANLIATKTGEYKKPVCLITTLRDSAKIFNYDMLQLRCKLVIKDYITPMKIVCNHLRMQLIFNGIFHRLLSDSPEDNCITVVANHVNHTIKISFVEKGFGLHAHHSMLNANDYDFSELMSPLWHTTIALAKLEGVKISETVQKGQGTVISLSIQQVVIEKECNNVVSIC